MRFLRFLPVVVLLACDGEAAPESVWVRFNAEDDAVGVSVTASDTLGPAATAELRSTSGERVLGQVSVDPGSGPVGTTHLVRVDLFEDYADAVGRAEIEADAGERGTWTIALEQDSADAGLWVRAVTSFGDVGEAREDVFTVRLFELQEVEPDAEVEE